MKEPGTESSGIESEPSTSDVVATADVAASQALELTRLLVAATPSTWVTPSLMVLLVASFALAAWFGVQPFDPTPESLLAMGAGFGPALLDGEWWRLASATLLHAGLVHLLVNLWALYSGGLLAERLFGNTAFLAIYVLSGVGGSLASIALTPLAISVGASGAIFGVYGALLAFTLTHRGVIPEQTLRDQRNSLVGFLLFNTYYALTAVGVDLAAHAGGFVTGGAAGLALTRDLRQPTAHAGRRASGAAVVGLVLASSAAGARARVENVPQIRAMLLMKDATRHLEEGRFEEGLATITSALLADPDDFQARTMRAAVLVDAGRLAEAESDCEVLLRSDVAEGASPWLYVACTRPPHARGDFDTALERIQRGKSHFPGVIEILATEADVQDDLGRSKLVRDLLDEALAIAPNDPFLLNNRAWQRIEDGDFETARLETVRALAQDPDSAPALGTQCFALAGLGEFEAARRDCERALSLSPDSDVDQGMLAWLDGRGADAIRAWTRVGASDPSLGRELAPWIARARAR